MSEFIPTEERQSLILDLLLRQGRLTVAEIVERFKVSEATARRDLEALAEQGKIQRVHGGALPVRQAPPEPPLLQRESEQFFEKNRIAQAAAALVQDGETVFIASGSTTLQVARQLRGRLLTVITNSLPVMNTLANVPNMSLIGIGGELRQSELSFVGHIAEQAIAELRADKVILGVHALSIEHGLTSDYLPEVLTDRAILKIGREVILVADHTKFNTVSTAFIAPITAVHCLVTDSAAPAEQVAALRELGLRVILA
jgi:DeoR/GlpR family transcriptional regulator of sugar metabolism